MKSTWQIRTLGDISIIECGNSAPQDLTAFQNGVFPFFRTSDVGKIKKGHISSSADSLNDVAIKKLRFFKRHSILFPKSGASVYLNHRVIMDVDGYVSSHLAVITPDESTVLPSYLLYYLCTVDSADLMQDNDYPSLKLTQISKISVPLPPLPEQKRIVGILDAAFEKIDAVQRNAERNLANAKELFQRVLDEEMTPQEGWEQKTLKEIGTTVTGQTPPTKDPLNFGKDVPFIKPADIVPFEGINYESEGLSFQGLKKSRLIKKNSILMVCIGASIGKVGYATEDVTCNQQINAVVPARQILGKFVFYALSSPVFQMLVVKNAAQATLPIISKAKWESLPINFPVEIAKQESIVCKLDELFEYCNLCSRNYADLLPKCAELKRQILAKAFNGEL